MLRRNPPPPPPTALAACSLHELHAEGAKRGTAAPIAATAADALAAAHAPTAKPSEMPVRPTLQYLVRLEVRQPSRGGAFTAQTRNPVPPPPPRPAAAYCQMERGTERMNSPGKYVSGARSVLRLMWFLDFLRSLLAQLADADSAKELRECAQVAYDTALASHHPWILRKTIGGAIYFLPHKATFLANLAAAGGLADTSSIQARLSAFLECMEPVRLSLWDFYRSHGIADLP